MGAPGPRSTSFLVISPVHRAVARADQGRRTRAIRCLGIPPDDVIGFVHVRDLLDPDLSSRTTPVAELRRTVLSMPDTVRVLRALSDMRRQRLAPGDRVGRVRRHGRRIVTMEDLVEELGSVTSPMSTTSSLRSGSA